MFLNGHLWHFDFLAALGLIEEPDIRRTSLIKLSGEFGQAIDLKRSEIGVLSL